jgi:glutathione S-transferase
MKGPDMKLYLNKTSPYARLVQIVVLEKGLDAEVERIWVDPWTMPADLVGANPLSKVPALVARDGLPLTESAGICDYLDEIGNGKKLLPAQGDARLSTLRKLGVGRGLTDAAFGVTIQRRFHGKDNAGELATRWLAAVHRAVEELESSNALGTPPNPDLGDLCIAVGLSYTQFRLPEVGWPAKAPKLVRWMEGMAARPSFAATQPE